MKYFKFKKTAILTMFALNVLILVSGCDTTFDSDGSSREDDQARLIKLMDEIRGLSEKVNCEDAEDWKFMPIGAKSCGGAAAYISYSIKIDTNDFIKKVNIYTAESRKFNVKWGIVSDCSIVNPPKGIKCEDGKPLLIY